MVKINIIVLGESGVGKTSLLKRFITGHFRENSTRSTFVDYHSKTLEVQDNKVEMVIWDTAGQELYHSLIRRYYAVADGVLLVYGVNNMMSFSKLSKWLTELRLENETAEVILAGNKNEDPMNKVVKISDVENFIEKENLQHLEVSAKTGENVDEVFHNLAEKVLKARGILPHIPDASSIVEEKVEKLFIEDVTVSYSPTVKNTVSQIFPLLRRSLTAIPSGVDELTAKKSVCDFMNSFFKSPSKGSFMYDPDTVPLKRVGNGYEWQANLDVLEDMLKNKSTQTLSGVYNGEALFLYGTESFFNVKEDELIPKYFPKAVKVAVKGAGHFIHHSHSEEFLGELLKFV